MRGANRKNRGATLEKTADSLNADYILFDELKKEQNIHEKAYRNKHLAVINQAPVNLLDPDNQIFESLNAERFEFYDELAWTDLLNRYLQGSVFLANPPMTDIVNDKGVSAAIPEIFKVFYGEEMELPVPGVTAFWSYDDFSKPDEKTVSMAKAEKDSFVIAHRYLEGDLVSE